METSALTFNGLTAYYYKKHPGRPTIAFLHDSLGCTVLWRNFPQQLADATRCNVLLYDRLGYGASAPMPAGERPVSYMETEADTLHDLLTHLEVDQVILFGHSDGGSIALITAGKYPQQIKAVICEAAHIFVEEITLKGIRTAMHAYNTTSLSERLQKYHGDKTDTLFRAWTETWTRDDFRDWNIEHFLPEITCPLLFIQGEADEYGTLAQVERTISQVSGKATQCILPGIGHTPHKEAPALTLGAAKEFIGKL